MAILKTCLVGLALSVVFLFTIPWLITRYADGASCAGPEGVAGRRCRTQSIKTVFAGIALLMMTIMLAACGDDDCHDAGAPAVVTVVVTFGPTTMTPIVLPSIVIPRTPGTPPVICFGGTPCPSRTPTAMPEAS